MSENQSNSKDTIIHHVKNDEYKSNQEDNLDNSNKLVKNENQDEEELSLDLSKLNPFKHKNKIKSLHKPQKEKKQKESEDEEDVESELSLNFKLPDVKSFFQNKKIFNTTTLIILLLLISMFFAVFYRAYPSYLPITDDWAENTVVNYYKNQILNQVNAEYPNLPNSEKQDLVNQRFSEVYDSEKANIDLAKAQLSEQYKSNFQDETGQTYLLAIDPYTYFRQTRNIIETGTICDEITDGTCWNSHIIAPKGTEMKLSGQVVVEYSLYKIMNIFKPGISILAGIYFLPALIILLGVIPAFFILKRKAGILGGFVASMVVALHPYLLGRTTAGFVDTDAYGITCSLYVIWMIIEAFHTKSYKSKALFAGLAGIMTYIFMQTWGGGWYFTFDIVLVTLLAIIIYQIVRVYIYLYRKNQNYKKVLHSKSVRGSSIIFFTYLLIVILTTGLSTVISVLKKPFSKAITMQAATHASLWPNVYTTVAELNVQSLTGIINSLISSHLGQMLMFLALLAIPLTLIKRYDKYSNYYLLSSLVIITVLTRANVIKTISANFYIFLVLLILLFGILLNFYKNQENRSDVTLITILSMLLVGSIFASVVGIRFVLLGIVPFSLMIGLTLGILYFKLAHALKHLIDIPQVLTKLIVIIFAVMLIFSYTDAANNVAKSEVPQMNDAWFQSLEKINDQGDQDAIITSWWDFGHWFKSIADRAVTFDGASQNSPMAHWVGKSLTTNNEDLSIGILRMLNCGSNDAFEILNSQLDNPSKTVDILDQIVQLEKSEAITYLQNEKIESSTISRLTKNTHCDPPQSFYITSQDMVSKAGVWAHFGLWDFSKADLYFNGRKKNLDDFLEVASKYNYSSEIATTLFDQIKMISSEPQANAWISPWPGYLGTGNCLKNASIVKCDFGRQIGSQEGYNIVLDSYVFDTQTKEGQAILGIYNTDGVRIDEYTDNLGLFVSDVTGDLVEHRITEGQFIDLGILNIGNVAVLSSTGLTNSIFTRLFYFDGAYTTHYKKFSDKRSEVSGDRIIIWGVDWAGTQNNVVAPITDISPTSEVSDINFDDIEDIVEELTLNQTETNTTNMNNVDNDSNVSIINISVN